MPTNFLGKPPSAWVIPVTRGCDRGLTVRRKNEAGSLVPWDADVYIVIDIDRADPTTVDATVDGAVASFVLDSDVCDLVKDSTKWRIVMSDGGLETPLAVGRFERYDG